MANNRGFSGFLYLALASLAAGSFAQGARIAPAGDRTASMYESRVLGDWRTSTPTVLPAAAVAVDPRADLGAASADARLERMILLLEPSAAKARALDAELAGQLNSSSSEFHRWITPAEFADRFANTPEDVAAVAAWLQAQGFAVAPVPAGRGWIEFSGQAAQVELAFHTSVRRLATASGVRFVLSGTVSVPSALRPLIQGLVSLDGVMASPAITGVAPASSTAAALAAATSREEARAVSPSLAAQMLHFAPAATAGKGQTIAIPSRSSASAADIAAFRGNFHLPAGSTEVVANGPDPGVTADQAVATLEASWAGALAPGARILLAPAASTSATDGLDLALAGIIDGNQANIVAVGFSACEAQLTEAHRAFYSVLYRQASAQGITIVAPSGDSGASACHAAGDSSPVTTGLGVNALASTPWNTAIGSASLQSSAPAVSSADLAAWSPQNPAESTYAGGGGASTVYGSPAWQPIPAHSIAGPFRLLPDLALPTAIDATVNHGLAFCLSSTEGSCHLVTSGGSAASAALFAGIVANVAEKNGAQGNVAPRLYDLARREGIFQDIEQGNARLACAAGSPSCDATGTIGYAAAAGYDMATGLGSVDAQKLITAWPTPDATGTGAASVLLNISPTVANATYNPTAQITFTATVVSGTGGATPTGTVLFFDKATNTDISASPSAVDANGVATLTVTSGLAQGGNNITAIYSGDATYASVTSQPVTVTIEPSTTALTVTPSTTTPAAGSTITVTTTLTTGIPPAGTIAPTGKVTLDLDGLPTATATLSTVAGSTTASFSVTIPSAGVHTLQTVYAGDVNYTASTSPAVTVTAAKGATVTSLTATPATLTAGTTESFTATIAPVSAASGTTYSITGTVNFYDGTTLLGTAVVNANSATLGNVTLAPSVLHTITAVYSGDTSWAASTSNAIALQSVLLPDSVTLAVSVNTTAPGQVVTLTATVSPIGIPATNVEQNPSGNVVFYDGTKILGTVALSAGLNYSSTATFITGTLPGGQNVLTAVYLGDLYYAAGTSNQVVIDVQDFTITPSAGNPGTNLNIIKGSSGSASFDITGLGGFNNQIQVVCTVPSQDDMTCSASPQQVTPPGTVTFTVQTYAAGNVTTASRRHDPLWPTAAGGVAFAALGFLLLPIGRRAKLFRTADRTRRALVLLMLLGGLAATGIGCSSTTTFTQSSGTPLGVATLKITAASYIDNAVVSHSLDLTVNVLPPATAAAVNPGFTHR